MVYGWDLSNDNIYLWDSYSLQTGGELYLKEDYALAMVDSHPSDDFSDSVARLLLNRIIDVIENNGRSTLLNGERV